jgi:hypothetical protein
MAVCPFLNEAELCSIYEDRPACCRNFPNRPSSFCGDAHRCNLNCVACKDKCCKHICMLPSMAASGGDIITPTMFIEALSISCEQCHQTWS